VEARATGDATGKPSTVALRPLIVGEALPTVGEGTFEDGVLASVDLLEAAGLSDATSTGSSTIWEPSITLEEVDAGSGEMMIDGANRVGSCSSVIECAFRRGDDERVRTIDSGWMPYLVNTSMLALRRPTCIDLRRGDVGKLSLTDVSEGDGDGSDPGEKDESEGVVPLSISRLRWYASFCETPARSRAAGPSNAPMELRRFFTPGDSSGTGNGEPERLAGPLGLFTLGMRFPYNSRLVFSPLSGGAPNPKLPRGIGTPPFDSNLAILERRLPTEPLVGDEGLEGEDCGDVCWPCWGAETLRCCRAAMRSFRFPTGGVCTLDLRTFTSSSIPNRRKRHTNID
jgi:hypothetical protein